MAASKDVGARLFTRQATGLVREVSWLDAAIYNLSWSSIPLVVAFILTTGTAFYLGADFRLTVVIALLLTLPTAALYAMLSAAVPRSGGDYTWVSRTIHPALGLMSNLSFCFWIVFFLGVYSVYVPIYGIAPLFRVLAAYTGDSGFLSASDFFQSSTGTIATGIAIVILSLLVLSVGRGLHAFMRLQRWAFVVWALGSVALPVILLALASPDSFKANFDAYASALGANAGAFDGAAAAANYSPSPTDLGATILGVTLPYYALGFIFQSAYFGGEIKRGGRSVLFSIPGAEVIAAIVILVVIVIFQNTISASLLAATGLAGAGALDLSPYGFSSPLVYTELASIAAGNPILGVIPVLGMIVVLAIWVPQTMILISRSLFAWSFDRLLPDRIAEVNPRTHSPLNAMAIITVVGIASVVIVGLNPSLTFVVGLIGLTWTYLIVSVAGILFPYRQRDAFEAGPFRGRLGGIPVMSIIGVGSLVAIAAVGVILLLDQNSGTSLALNSDRVILGIGVLAAGLPIYYILRTIQRSRGIDIALAYRELPPE